MNLRPCPFCGGVAEYEDNEFYSGLFCQKCGYGWNAEDGEEQIISDWNTRPIEDALTARITDLERELAAARERERTLEKRISEVEPWLASYLRKHIHTIPTIQDMPDKDFRVIAWDDCEKKWRIGVWQLPARRWVFEDGTIFHGNSIFPGGALSAITHWRILPEPPEEKC